MSSHQRKNRNRKRPRKPIRRTRVPKNVLHMGFGAPQPPVVQTTLNYFTYVDFAFASANLPYGYQFNANSLFDPDRTGVGHQPYGFDYLALSYNRYRVMRFRYRVDITPPNDVANSTIEFVGMLRNGTYSVVYPDVYEMPFTKRTMVSTNARPAILKNHHNLQLVSSRAVQYRNDDRTAADTSSSPAEVILFIIAALSNQTNVIRLNVTLTFDCEFYDPLPMGSSMEARMKSHVKEASKNPRPRHVVAVPMKFDKNYVPPPPLPKIGSIPSDSD